MEQNFLERGSLFSFDEAESVKQKCQTISPHETIAEKDHDSFECNICLDSANEPVVTFCGHLYCWPCIYKWLHVKSSAIEEDQQPNCPVCKAKISAGSLIPLYGRGISPSKSESKKQDLDLDIPRRPSPNLNTSSASSTSTSLPNRRIRTQPMHHLQYHPHSHGGYSASISSDFGGTTAMASFLNPPTIGMFGEMVYARMFGSPETSLFNQFALMSSSNPRMRRQEMQLDKSLNRVSIFLLCCLITCLLLF